MRGSRAADVDAPMWPDTRRPAPPSSGGRHLLVALLVIGLAVGVGAFLLRGHGHRGGDPDGRILRALSTPAHAPTGAKVTRRQAVEPYWDSCDGRPGTQGWDDVTVDVEFSSAEPEPQVESAVDASFRAAGWKPVGDDWWTGRAAGSAAHASLQRSSDGGGWELVATARPVGRAVSGC